MSVDRLEESEFLKQLEAEHRAWLAAFDPQYLTNFDRLRKADFEAAMTEAGVRRMLQSFDVSVEPAEDLVGGQKRPDFLCRKYGHKFYVEVTNLSIKTVTAETGLSHIPKPGARNCGSLASSLWQACQRKTAQCVGLGHPVLIAVGTYHAWASSICLSEQDLDMLLTGQTSITWQVDPRTGSSDGETHLTTELYSAAFLKPAHDAIGFARSPVSGLLVCGGFDGPFSVLGLLHPNPDNRFDPLLLPDVSFGEVVINNSTRQLLTRWNGKTDDEEE